ncbi:HD domain-containing protein [Salinarimonas sp.]|uniref:HD domain-containing protein n=1 Tax=Salinarimonas sp. TaxID=2766526 RepID=UPI00391D90C9
MARVASAPRGSKAPPRAWQRMLSGRRLDLLDPSPIDVELEDIAHGLARVARWNGQTRGAHVFSVAQHSLLVEAVARRLAPETTRETRLGILLHDAPEYVIGDMISPFKAVIGDVYKDTERRLAAAVRLHFGLSAAPPRAEAALAKRADRTAAFLEATRLAGFSEAEARRFFGTPEGAPPDLEAWLPPWPADDAARRFKERCKELAHPSP